jgi:hypothetical protein
MLVEGTCTGLLYRAEAEAGPSAANVREHAEWICTSMRSYSAFRRACSSCSVPSVPVDIACSRYRISGTEFLHHYNANMV